MSSKKKSALQQFYDDKADTPLVDWAADIIGQCECLNVEEKEAWLKRYKEQAGR